MPLPAFQVLEKKIERQIRLFELKRGVLERKIEKKFETHKSKFEQKFETHRRRFEQKFESQRKKFESQIRRFEERNGIRLDDEVRFFRSWIEKPLAIGSVTPSGKALARTMAGYVDPAIAGPIIATFCRLLRGRYGAATVVQGDAYGLRRLVSQVLREPAAAVVSGLPLFTKPMQMRLRLLYEAFGLMRPGAPFVQFTYHAVPPIPKALDRVKAEASERIWLNIPPARVWVYRKH